jgi:hypothetical protein
MANGEGGDQEIMISGSGYQHCKASCGEIREQGIYDG